MGYQIRQGNYEKMGASRLGDDVMFTFACPNGEDCAVLLYKKGTQSRPTVIDVPKSYRIGSLYSVLVQGISLDTFDYNYRIGKKVVTDPYAGRIVGREKWADRSRLSDPHSLRSSDYPESFDWDGDERVHLSDEEMILYKLHVRAFTKGGLTKGARKGTFAGVQDAIPYLKELGVTSVELMPIYEFEEIMPQENKPAYQNYEAWKEQQEKPEGAEPLKQEEPPLKLNVWGYKEADYFAPKASFAAGDDPAGEVRELVRALHRNRMECILEFFFPEGYTGSYVVSVLRYWVREYHVDGVHLLGHHLPMREIIGDPLLSDTKIFYTGFDGEFISGNKEKNRLFVYNDEYQYPARKMLNRLEMNLDELVSQIVKWHPAEGFVNYITSNNGFTLYDLFSYTEKHNEANGEGNTDGSNWNYSANYGEEGKSRKKAVNLERDRQMRNAFSLLLLSKGVPLIYEGDELMNSKDGNNNTYCQDSRASYVTWSKRKQNLEMREFVKRLIAFRKSHPVLSDRGIQGKTVRPESGLPEISYHGENAWISGPEYGRCAIGILYCGEYIVDEAGKTDDLIYVAYNFMGGQQTLALPKLPFEGNWVKIMDTAVPAEPFLKKPERTRDQRIYMPGRSVRIYIGKRSAVKKAAVKPEHNGKQK